MKATKYADENDRIEHVARAAHEVNRAFCAQLGDDSQVPWEDAPAWQRESAIEGVKAIVADPTLPPSASHEGWLKHKQRSGWVYGPVKDVDSKTHPCMVHYDVLPPEQRAKDAIFGAVVRGILGLD